MTASLPPMIRFQPLVAGACLPGGSVYFYAAGTTTPQAVYAADGTTPLSNPLVLDANGATDFRLGDAVSYKILLKDSTGATVTGWPVDGVKISDYWATTLNAATLADLANTTDLAKGDAMIGVKQPWTGATATTQHEFNTRMISVKDFGAKGDGATDDTAAIQAAFTYLNTYQQTGGQWAAYDFLKEQIYFPEGVYRISDTIKVRGMVIIRGVGEGSLGGSAVHQVTANKHIFEFQCFSATGTFVSTHVEGMTFEFDRALALTNQAYALYYPHVGDLSPYNNNSSNSHYIKGNRFNGWHSRGSCIWMQGTNDFEITGNCFDVCLNTNVAGTAALPALLIGSETAHMPQSNDGRIANNEFYQCINSIRISAGQCCTITGNNFDLATLDYFSRAIRVVYDAGTPTDGYNNNIVISCNTFWKQLFCLNVDASAINISFVNNTCYQCNNAPIVISGTNIVKRLMVKGNNFHLNSVTDAGLALIAYTNAFAPLFFENYAGIQDSTISDNIIDANAMNGVVSLCNDNTTTPFVGSGCTIRNNQIVNNTSVSGRTKTYLPCATKELVLENVITTTTTLPTNAVLFTLTTIASGESLSFDLDYDVRMVKVATNNGSKVGKVRICVIREASAGVLKYDVTSLNSVGDDYNGGGAAWFPTVVFAVTTGSPATVTVTVTNVQYTDPTTTTVSVKASNFFATGATAGLPAIKCA